MNKRLALLLLIPPVLILMYYALPVGIDWRDTYRPAALAAAQGQSPYTVDIYYAAPWAAWLLAPVAMLPYNLSRMVIFFIGLCAFAYVAYRANASIYTLAVFMCSAAVVGCLNNGNIEWLPLLGVTCPPWLGLILLAIKPQVGLGLILFWAVVLFFDKGWKAMLYAFAPLTVLTLFSFWAYGFWPGRFSQTLAWSVDNTSLGMQGVFIGAGALMYALRDRDERVALAASPFLAPYVLQFTWVACSVGLLRHPQELTAVVVFLWIPVIIRVLG